MNTIRSLCAQIPIHMHKFLPVLFLIMVQTALKAQKPAGVIDPEQVRRVLSVLSSDEMAGRKAMTPSIDKAAAFLQEEFRKAGLQPLDGARDFLQEFFLTRSETLSAEVVLDGSPLGADKVIVFAGKEQLRWKTGDAKKVVPAKGDRRAIGEALSGTGNTLVILDSNNRDLFNRLRNFKMQRPTGSGDLVIVNTDRDPSSYSVSVDSRLLQSRLANVVGMIPGRSRNKEYVVFSGHYDHLGIGKPVGNDSIYNGANDDASGTTAVVELAGYFHGKGDNERSLVFAAFTAEESGGYGSQFFSKQLDPASVVAMFNIEMIGTESKWGRNSAYITGYERSDFGKILQENLQGSVFTFQPDPYPEQNLFFRSDNATLARLGVPAHTISTSKMDSEKYYHTVGDEIGTLDLGNMAAIIEAIAVSSRGIVSGKQTPSRVTLEQGR
jgi:hypothetical protein